MQNSAASGSSETAAATAPPAGKGNPRKRQEKKNRKAGGKKAVVDPIASAAATAGSTKQGKPAVEEKKRSGGRRDKAAAREEEVRELTSRLREKEEQLKELEAAQSRESAAQSAALAKKVEDEVTQKLFKASVLSNMYKNSLSSSVQSDNTTKPAKDQSQASLKPSKSAAPGRNKQRPRGRGESAGGVLRVPSGCGPGSSRSNGNTSTQQDDATAPATAIPAGSSSRESDSGTGGGRGKGGVRGEVKAYEMTAEERRERDQARAARERAASDRRIATTEADIKDIMNNIRKSKPLLQDFCLLGIRHGSPVDFVEKCRVLEAHYSAQLLQEARLPSSSASEEAPPPAEGSGDGAQLGKWAHKMCKLWAMQVSLIRQVIDKAEQKGGVDSDTLSQIRNVLLLELDGFIRRLLSILEPLQLILCEDFSPVTAAHNATEEALEVSPFEVSPLEKNLRSAVQVFLLAIAEFTRLQLVYDCFGGNSPRGAERQTRRREQLEGFLERAVAVAPHDGAPFESLSKLALGQGAECFTEASGGQNREERDVFLAAYYMARGMGAQKPLLAAREALLDIFEEQKAESDRLENVTALSRLALSEHVCRFKVHFLAAVGVAYSRTGADRLGQHLTKARRHVGTMLQLVSTAHLSEQNRGSKGQFSAYDQSAFQKQSRASGQQAVVCLGVDESQQAECRDLDQSLSQALLIALSLIESVGTMHGIQQVCDESKWSAAYANWIDQGTDVEELTLDDHIAHIDAEERSLIERRYAVQRLHRVQSAPGLVDLLRLVVGLLSSLLSTESIGNILDSARREGNHTGLNKSKGKGSAVAEVTPRELATTRVLALFFEWLESHPEYHAAIAVLDLDAGAGGGGWESVEAGLPLLATSMRALADPLLSGSSPAPHTAPLVTSDDADLRGFVPLRLNMAKVTAELEVLERSAVLKFAEPSSQIPFDSPQEYVRSKLVNFEHQPVVWLCHYASRCCRAMRGLCNLPVRLGEITFHRDPVSGKRQARLPSDDASTALTVIVYKSLAPASLSGYNYMFEKAHGLGSGKSKILLSEEEFMSGTVVNDKAEGQGGGDVSLLPGDIEEPEKSSDGDDSDGESDLDLSNLVLEDVEADERPLPPPGFSALPQQQDQHASSSCSSKNVDDDFAAMCAALLTVPLTDDSTEQSFSETGSREKNSAKAKEKAGGLLHVKVPSLAPVPSPAETHTLKPEKPKSHSQPRSRGKDAQKVSGSRVYRSASLTASGDIPLIVVDAPNVAMRHGLNAKFSCKGIQLALNFFHSAGHKVIAFLPDYYLNFERVGELRRLASLNLGDVRAAQLPDDIEILRQLVQQGVVIGTPSQDYDDSYCITYAQRRGGYIISNDMYRDHVKRIEGKVPREEARKWIKSHVISYTFVGDEFLPNPDASIFAR